MTHSFVRRMIKESYVIINHDSGKLFKEGVIVYIKVLAHYLSG
jgi:hypothetical protein